MRVGATVVAIAALVLVLILDSWPLAVAIAVASTAISLWVDRRAAEPPSRR